MWHRQTNRGSFGGWWRSQVLVLSRQLMISFVEVRLGQTLRTVARHCMQWSPTTSAMQMCGKMMSWLNHVKSFMCQMHPNAKCIFRLKSRSCCEMMWNHTFTGGSPWSCRSPWKGCLEGTAYGRVWDSTMTVAPDVLPDEVLHCHLPSGNWWSALGQHYDYSGRERFLCQEVSPNYFESPKHSCSYSILNHTLCPHIQQSFNWVKYSYLKLIWAMVKIPEDQFSREGVNMIRYMHWTLQNEAPPPSKKMTFKWITLQCKWITFMIEHPGQSWLKRSRAFFTRPKGCHDDTVWDLGGNYTPVER